MMSTPELRWLAAMPAPQPCCRHVLLRHPTARPSSTRTFAPTLRRGDTDKGTGGGGPCIPSPRLGTDALPIFVIPYLPFASMLSITRLVSVRCARCLPPRMRETWDTTLGRIAWLRTAQRAAVATP